MHSHIRSYAHTTFTLFALIHTWFTLVHRRLSIDSDTLSGGGPRAFAKRDVRLASGAAAEALTADFLRKYIIYARRR